MSYTKTVDWRVLISEEMGDAADEDRRRFVAGVYVESGPRLYRYALMLLADRLDAEDMLQQVFAAVLSMRTLPAIDETGAYFRTAVRNAAYSLLRYDDGGGVYGLGSGTPIPRPNEAPRRGGDIGIRLPITPHP